MAEIEDTQTFDEQPDEGDRQVETEGGEQAQGGAVEGADEGADQGDETGQ